MRQVAVELLAPAKINLTLHVVGRRADGYHLLDGLTVFVEVGDVVALRPAAAMSLAVSGPYAAAVPAGEDNLVLRAARLAGAEVEIALDKALPVGAGIGGGSSDAAAVLRGIAAMLGQAPPDALSLGADVPVCLAARPARMRGIGDRLVPLPPLPELPMVLIHPGVALSTPAVFSDLASADCAPMPDQIPGWTSPRDAADWLAGQRNDLAPAAVGLAPVIAEARAALQNTGPCLLARMSGSGSSVFGLYPSDADAGRAAVEIGERRPDWWVRATRVLRAAPRVQERRLTT